MRMMQILVVSVFVCAGTGVTAGARTRRPRRRCIANERAVNEAFAKGNAAGFTAHVATDGWAIDSTMGRAPVADLVKDFAAITKEMKISSWDISDSKD